MWTPILLQFFSGIVLGSTPTGNNGERHGLAVYVHKYSTFFLKLSLTKNKDKICKKNFYSCRKELVVGGAEYSGGDEHAEEDERGGAEQAPGLVPAKLHLNHQNLQLFMITTELGTRQIFSFATTVTRQRQRDNVYIRA